MRKEYDFGKLEKAEPKYLRRVKRTVTMRLDPSVVAYFRELGDQLGMPYQTLINYVLREYANQRLEPSANWPRKRKRAS